MYRWSLRDMKRGRIVIPVFVFCLAAVFIAVFFLGQASGASSTRVPGSESDPLVTASWVEAKINERMRGLSGNASTEAPAASREPVYITFPAPAYRVVSVPAGKKMLTGAGTEIILRSGNAKIVEGPGGGFSDLTLGANLSDGASVARDHLLLSPKDDGRGIVAGSNTIFLVRGDYNIK